MLMKTPEPERGSDDHQEDAQGRRLGFLLGLMAAAAVVVFGLWIVWRMWQNEKLQECLMTGRRDCAPVAVP